MAIKTFGLPEDLHNYMIAQSLREPEVLRDLREQSASMKEASWQVAREQAQFMALLAEINGTKRYLELGTFIGYGTLWMALAMPADGEIITCEIAHEFVAMGRKAWREAGIAHKIDVRLGPAIDTLDTLLDKGEAGKFDMAFIDADKPPYVEYYERCLELVRPGGLVLIDNVFWDGAVLDTRSNHGSTRAIRNLNNLVRDDKRVSISMLPLGDGLTIARKLSIPLCQSSPTPSNKCYR